MNKEFYEDGGNFESSTSYHRLSGELIVYSTSIILGLGKTKLQCLQNYRSKKWNKTPKLKPLENQQYTINTSTWKIELPQWYKDKLYKIGRFTADITKQNGDIPQFGDNDSGRFFRLSPNGCFLTNKEAKDKYLHLQNHPYNNNLFWDENILNHSSFLGCISGLFKDPIFF